MIALCTTCGKILIKYKGSLLWNNLPENLKSLQTNSTFKTCLKKTLLMNTS